MLPEDLIGFVERVFNKDGKLREGFSMVRRTRQHPFRPGDLVIGSGSDMMPLSGDGRTGGLPQEKACSICYPTLMSLREAR